MLENTSKTPSDDSINSITRIKEYPVIKDTFSKAGEYYNWIKSQSNTLSSTLDWTENVVKNAANKVEPLAASQLEALDKYACSKLDNLENKYPIVKEPSQEVIKSTSEYIGSSIKPGMTYITSLPYRITTQSIEILSNTTNNFVSRYMGSPPSGDSVDGSTSVSTNPNYNLMFKEAIKEIDTIKHYTSENIRSFNNLLSSIYNKTITNNEEWVRKYYEEFRTEVGVQSTTAKTDTDPNSRLMHIALDLSNKMRVSVRAMSAVCYKHLSPEYQGKLDAVFLKTEQLYGNINKSTYDTIRDQISIENVHWIGETAINILGNAKEAILEKYKENTGKDANIDEVNKEVISGDLSDPVSESKN